MAAGGLPVPARQRFVAQQMQRRRAEVAAAGGGGGAQREAGPEGVPGQPLDIQASLNELMGLLQRVLDFIPAAAANSDGYESSSSSRGGDS